MNILVIGSGGREHSLCWKIAQSPLVETVYAAPGNGGMGECATLVTLNTSDHEAVIKFCVDKGIDLVVVGPEQPLVEGLVDSLTSASIPAFGPTAAAAQLEGSKGFTKDICAEYKIPTAAYGRFDNIEDARAYVVAQGAPIVIKADGLAAGKGVILADSLDEALTALDDIFGGAFGEAGAEVVVEEMLIGEEASFFVLCDGQSVLPMISAQDHKAVGEGDTGPNTGGMGAYSPAAIMDAAMEKRVLDEIITPTVTAMRDKGHPYKGVFFAGLMITAKGPQLIEYNCRFGDPECQVLMTRMTSDIVPALLATANGTLSDHSFTWSDHAVMNVVMCAKGYPGPYEKGTEIKGIETAEAATGAKVFHAGTRRQEGQIIATGGRVLNIVSQAKTVTDAQKQAYETVSKIDWPNGFTRNDIGWRAIERESKN
ncbi:phosphoribosylamine--glycine ligase [Temperatibacter marinus]|uniref:Phosphoribosylamine--glycine ligase n=1 Tax=Temperatibacter marinus TaxID=1456591 RepID=A0AA52EGE9_9PROT|nr:phosphoribosylamine--glycine ligase [Temperatibacter marinus]WND01601.1 phosphoribosylamine--glycine ligase [Temperatibacter marinus]